MVGRSPSPLAGGDGPSLGDRRTSRPVLGEFVKDLEVIATSLAMVLNSFCVNALGGVGFDPLF